MHRSKAGHSLSALGQKRTSPVHPAMSALPPKADMEPHDGHIRLVPKRTNAPQQKAPLSDRITSSARTGRTGKRQGSGVRSGQYRRTRSGKRHAVYAAHARCEGRRQRGGPEDAPVLVWHCGHRPSIHLVEIGGSNRRKCPTRAIGTFSTLKSTRAPLALADR